MKKIKPIILALATIVFFQPSFADNNKNPEFKSTELSTSLVLLQGKGGNILLSRGDDGVLIIDDDYADMAGALKQQIDNFGQGKLKYIINTHWHGDHSGSNAALGHGVDIIAHNNVRERLSKPQYVAIFNMRSDAFPDHALPNLTYPDSMQLHFNNDHITLQHYPNGHTDGDSIVFFQEANVVHMGDHFFNGFFPFVDIASGGNVLSYADNVTAVLARIDDNTIVIPGHGSKANKQDLINFQRMLKTTVAEVSSMKKAGLTVEQAQAKGLSEQWQSWNSGPIKIDTWISFIYSSLQLKK